MRSSQKSGRRPNSRKEALKKGRENWCFVTEGLAPEAPELDAKSPFPGTGCSPMAVPQTSRTMTYTRSTTVTSRKLKQPDSVKQEAQTPRGTSSSSKGGVKRVEALNMAELIVKEMEQPDRHPTSVLSSLGFEPVSLPLLTAAAHQLSSTTATGGGGSRVTPNNNQERPNTSECNVPAMLSWENVPRPYSSESAQSVFLTSKRLLMGSPSKGQRLVLSSKRSTVVPPSHREETLQRFENLRQFNSSRENHLSRGMTSSAGDLGDLGETEPPTHVSDDLRDEDDEDENAFGAREASTPEPIVVGSPVKLTISDGKTVVKEVAMRDQQIDADVSAEVTQDEVGAQAQAKTTPPFDTPPESTKSTAVLEVGIDASGSGPPVVRVDTAPTSPHQGQDGSPLEPHDRRRSSGGEFQPQCSVDSGLFDPTTLEIMSSDGAGDGSTRKNSAGTSLHSTTSTGTDLQEAVQRDDKVVRVIAPAGDAPKGKKRKRSVNFSIAGKKVKKQPPPEELPFSASDQPFIQILQPSFTVPDTANSSTTADPVARNPGNMSAPSDPTLLNSRTAPPARRKSQSFGVLPMSPRSPNSDSKNSTFPTSSINRTPIRRRSTMTRDIENMTNRNLADVEHPFGYFSNAVEEMAETFEFIKDPEELRQLKRLVGDLKHTDLCRRFGQFHPLPALPDRAIRHKQTKTVAISENPETKALHAKRQLLVRSNVEVATSGMRPRKTGKAKSRLVPPNATTPGGLTAEQELGQMMVQAKAEAHQQYEQEQQQQRRRTRSTGEESVSSTGVTRSRANSTSSSASPKSNYRTHGIGSTSPSQKKKKMSSSWRPMAESSFRAENGLAGWEEDVLSTDDSGDSEPENDGSSFVVGQPVPATTLAPAQSSPRARGKAGKAKPGKAGILSVSRMTPQNKSPSSPGVVSPRALHGNTPRSSLVQPRPSSETSSLNVSVSQSGRPLSPSQQSIPSILSLAHSPSSASPIQPQAPKPKRKDNPFHERYLRLDKVENDPQQVALHQRVDGYVAHLQAIGMLK